MSGAYVGVPVVSPPRRGRSVESVSVENVGVPVVSPPRRGRWVQVALPSPSGWSIGTLRFGGGAGWH